VSRYEERVYVTGTAKKSVADLRKQLTVLRGDLQQYMARNPRGPMVDPLREQIRRLEAEIADAEASKKRDRDARTETEGEEGAPSADGRPARPMRATSGHFPPRRRGP